VTGGPNIHAFQAIYPAALDFLGALTDFAVDESARNRPAVLAIFLNGTGLGRSMVLSEDARNRLVNVGHVALCNPQVLPSGGCAVVPRDNHIEVHWFGQVEIHERRGAFALICGRRNVVGEAITRLGASSSSQQTKEQD
jgi:hypothetical protein